MRWIIRFVVSLVVVFILAVVVLLLVPGDRIARLAEEQFEDATGRAITIDADVQATIWPLLGVRTGAVEVANAPWSNAGPMVTAQGLQVGVSPLALLRGRVEIQRVELISPAVLLEVAADGRANWSFGAQGTAQTQTAGSQPGGIPAFTLGKGSVTGGALRWLDHRSNTDIAIENMSLTLELPAFDGPGQLAFEAVLHGVPQMVSAEIARFGPFVNGAVSELQAAVKIGDSGVEFDGRGGLFPLALEGEVVADLADMAALYRTAGLAPVAVPYGFGQEIAFEGDVTLTEAQTLHLRDAALTLDQNLLSGEADLDLTSDRPQLSAHFSAGALDFSSLASGADTSGENEVSVGATGWSRAEIDAGFLGLANGEFVFQAESIDLGTLQLGQTRAHAALERSRVVFDLREISAYGGNVTGRFVMNNRNGLSVGGGLEFAGIALQPLLADLAGYERLIGTADVEAEFLGVGNTMHAIMNSLSGQGRFVIGQGELRGLDLVGMLRNFDLSFEGEGQKTIFDSASASFVVEGGVLRNDDLAFVASGLRADGDGLVGIGARTLDYRLRPQALGGDDGTDGITLPLKITGTWDDPRFGPDLEALAEQNLAEERAAAQARLEAERAALEARANEKIEEELGVTREEGESVEDALRRGLEAEAKDALLNLLGSGN